MKRKLRVIHKEKRKSYESPKLQVIQLQMEQGIAAGSAAVTAPNQSGEVLDEWEIGNDRNTDINW